MVYNVKFVGQARTCSTIPCNVVDSHLRGCYQEYIITRVSNVMLTREITVHVPVIYYSVSVIYVYWSITDTFTAFSHVRVTLLCTRRLDTLVIILLVLLHHINVLVTQ